MVALRVPAPMSTSGEHRCQRVVGVGLETRTPERRLYAEGPARGSFSDVSDTADRSENSSLNLLAAMVDVSPDQYQRQMGPIAKKEKPIWCVGPRGCIPSSLSNWISNAPDLFCRMFSWRYVLQNT